jgi:hypothetical protein
MAIPFHSPTFTAHNVPIMYIDFFLMFLETSPSARPTWAETIICSYEEMKKMKKSTGHQI